jgi:Secretion system C-terminal sorting domain
MKSAVIFCILFTSFTYAQVITVCRNSLNKPILDHQTTLDTILLTLPPNSRILDVNIRIDTVLHTYDSDLRFYLRHSGTGVSFIRNVGAGGDNFIFTNINDSAACAIGSSSCNLPPFSGAFKPTAPANLLAFNYQPANGLWVIAITDTFPQDEGMLKAWCVTITYDNLLLAENNNGNIPSEYSLYQNYPNPFNPDTRIKFDIPVNSEFRTSSVKLNIYDILGREIAEPINELLKPGTYEIQWDASVFPSGVYYYRLETPYFTSTKKMLLIK